MDSVEYARGHEQLEPVRNVHAPLLRKSDAGHAASVRLAAPYTEEKMPLFTVTKLQVKLLGSVGMLNLHRYMMWRMGRIGSSGKQRQGSEFTNDSTAGQLSCTMIAVIALGCTSSCSPHT
jgi:hypothetical protein